MKFELSAEDYRLLMLALGMAAGEAMKVQQNESLGRAIFRLANAINKDNPNWRPEGPLAELLSEKANKER